MQDKETPESLRLMLIDLGQYLQKARTRQELTIEEVSENLMMHKKYINALEQGQYEKIPGPSALFSLLRAYTGALGLDSDSIINECKKNKFLMNEYLASGVVDISSNQSKKNEVNISYSNNAKYDSENHSNELKKLKNSNFLKLNKRATILFSFLALFLLIFLGRNLVNLPLNIPINISNSLSSLLPNFTCSQFTLKVNEKTNLKIQSLVTGANLLNRDVFKGEEMIFSDSKGVKIYTSDPTAVELFYKNKSVDWFKIYQDQDLYIYKCN
ncbi:MAG: helix-turn-helix transcriptional regulator [Candidatus Caenarcaniphilales bacterium]|nr:helix-turn-helix transcriptional regulator [Candidatus Caenarcaniphilales bacterium]